MAQLRPAISAAPPATNIVRIFHAPKNLACFGTSMIKMVCSCFNSHFSSFEMVIISIVHVLKMSLISILRKYMYMPSLLGSVSTATNLHSVSPSLFSGCDLPIDGSSHTALELHLPGFFVCLLPKSLTLPRPPPPFGDYLVCVCNSNC